MPAAVDASYYTDPACPWSWAMEPTLRRLDAEFGSEIEIAYVMGGLAREFGAPERVAASWLEAAARSAMPVDPRLWLSAPPSSSYPACLAVAAASEQAAAAPEAVGRYLRRLREGLACGRRKLDTAEALVAEAHAVPGLDAERLRIALHSSATVERFGADLERARTAGADGGAVALPTVTLRAAGGETVRLEGYAEMATVLDAVRAAGAHGGWTAFGGAPPGVEQALRRYGTLATAEVAAVCDLPGPRAAAELWRLAAEWRVRPERRLTDWLWEPAT